MCCTSFQAISVPTADVDQIRDLTFGPSIPFRFPPKLQRALHDVLIALALKESVCLEKEQGICSLLFLPSWEAIGTRQELRRRS